jgi:signal transduction histidine kinase
MSLAPSSTGQIFRNQSGQIFRNHQRVVERHGGGISARSARGKGATFSFWLGNAGKVAAT